MKFLAIICEFNPFHNGHAYLIKRAKELYACDGVICIMSGNFTQRGDICVLDKYTRARHAILGGADCVIQLPSPFAVAPAEIFATGAIKILSSIPEITALAFGCENDSKEKFIRAADLLIDESESFKNALNQNLARGESYIKSYAAAFCGCGGNEELVTNPNNILALEYVKAIKKLKSKIDIVPVKRVGGGYNDSELKSDYSSASAIRKNFSSPAVKDNLPVFVYRDLPSRLFAKEYGEFLRNCLFKTTRERLKAIYGCSEGLENKLKADQNLPLEELIENATSRRYSSSRIRRILCANALELYADQTQIFLIGDLYIKPLAVKKSVANKILPALAKSRYPVITTAKTKALDGAANQCFEKDAGEFEAYRHITRKSIKDYMITV